MSKEAAQNPSADIAVWFDGKAINEVIFCEEFLRDYPMITVNGTFFTVNGIVNIKCQDLMYKKYYIKMYN